MIVSKFGGTSLADADQIKKVLAIVRSDPKRRYIVVSAPGKRSALDRKITDILYEWHRYKVSSVMSRKIQQIIHDRYAEIVRNLGINFDLNTEFLEIARRISEGASSDYVASRGEYLNGKIIAVALGYTFVDPATCIHFDKSGRYAKSDVDISASLVKVNAVIPGFYGSMPDGSIKTFSRGGSDITGAIVASGVKADVYENWTDVSGLLMADPRIVANPMKIETVTYRKLRELSYMGASVFHEEAMFPVQEVGIPTNIRNTNDPANLGSYIVAEDNRATNQKIITGIAGRKNFAVIRVEKRMMNQEVGFVRKILTVLEANGVSFEHMPSGIDTLSMIIQNQQLHGKAEKVMIEIGDCCSPDTLEMYHDMAMIAIVGRKMVHTPGVAAKVFGALSNKGISVRMINQGSSEISIIIGVENDDYENAIRAIYDAFVK